MVISLIIILACFIGVIILIVTEKLNRAIAALTGAIITYFVLIFIEDLDFSVIVELLFGTRDDNYVNLHSLILIISMMIIVLVCYDAGLFQFLAIKLIVFSKGKPIRLFVINCSITVIISALLNNILAVIILIPLTITISRILNTNPYPYILTQAIVVNIGGSIFLISSIPNILIATYANISFLDFFFNVGLISIVVFCFTILFFIFLYKNELKIPEEGSKTLQEFNVWNFVQNKKLLYESMSALIILILLFIIIPSDLVTPDMIALSIALILIIISRLNAKEIISKIDFELIFYLLGIFIISGALELIGFTAQIGQFLISISGGDQFFQIILVLWFSALLSSSIDNIPITKVLIPVVGSMSVGNHSANDNMLFYSLAIGSNWGDNLTPLGDNILVMNIAEQNKRPLKFKQFFKLGFVTTIYQLIIVSLIFLILFHLINGIIIVSIILFVISLIYLIQKKGPGNISNHINKIINKFRTKIIE
jgi:Na+/H+ antiporter NhaD/arsenite permease-like protein